MMHHILEIASHLHNYKYDASLKNVVGPKKLKYLKYWKDIPLLSFAFILDAIAKMRGLYNVLQLCVQCNFTDYISYFGDVKTELYKLFRKV